MLLLPCHLCCDQLPVRQRQCGVSTLPRRLTCSLFSAATYYGMNQWSGYCQGNMQAKGKAWPPNGGAFNGMRVALNAPQFGGGGTVAPCGRTLRYRGTGTGSGGNPISRSWQTTMVTNLCPECKYGSIDLGTSGDGRCVSTSTSAGLCAHLQLNAKTCTPVLPRWTLRTHFKALYLGSNSAAKHRLARVLANQALT